MKVQLQRYKIKTPFEIKVLALGVILCALGLLMIALSMAERF